MDGTLFRGDTVLPHATEVVAALRASGAKITYVTNNSSATRESYVGKLRALGFSAEPEDIVSSAVGGAAYLIERRLKSAWVLGEPGLAATLLEAGIEVVNQNSDGLLHPSASRAEALVAGICRTGFTYSMLDAAMQQVLGGAAFIATNRDATYPLEGERLAPGAGAIVAALAAATGSEPLVVGKPEPRLIELSLSRMGLEPKEVLVVGDRMDTDIASGAAAGCDTHLVLTGVSRTSSGAASFSDDLRALL